MGRVLLGMLIAASFGSGDYAGGRASRRASAAAVLVVAQMCSVVGAIALVAAVPGDTVGRDLGLGALAGAVNVVGLALLYDGLGRHAAAVVAPIAAVVGSTVPVGWGVATGERPSTTVLAGVFAAIVAGAVIALQPKKKEEEDVELVAVASGALQAVAAGLALGSSLVLFSETSEDSGQWPVLTARAAALVTVAIAAAAFARRRREDGGFPHDNDRWLAIAAGAFDVAATALLVYAVRRELLVVVAPIASLAPAFTVVLAWAIARERIPPVQLAGLGLALVGLALIAGG